MSAWPLRPLLGLLGPEAAHGLAIEALARLPTPAARPDDPRLKVDAFGLQFPNPIGMAAGFDKNAQAYRGLFGLGFGFVEVGTLTPRPQPGNPRPRVFRLLEDDAIVNRLGFNGEGHASALARLRRRPGGGVLGVNIGANKDAADRVGDYVAGVRAFAGLADYFTLNVSSPNTPGLRDLQHEAALDDLLARALDARGDSATPVLLKIAPDLRARDLDAIVAIARARRIDGMIVSNTTLSRPPGLRSAARAETGGLSGRPLFARSTAMLAATFVRVERQFPLIGVGGVDGADAAWAKIRAGAHLVQLYTALVYRGPGLIGEIKRGVLERLASGGHASLAAAMGGEAAEWAAKVA